MRLEHLVLSESEEVLKETEGGRDMTKNYGSQTERAPDVQNWNNLKTN